MGNEEKILCEHCGYRMECEEQMREKLIELLREGCSAGEGCSDKTCFDCFADILIANGVTVRKKGDWEFCHHYHSCSECGHIVGLISSLNFCPNCGADMRGEEHE
jgi:rubrerythrin